MPDNVKTLGVLGGLGPMAIVYFMEMVTRLTDAGTDQMHIPMIVISDPTTPDRTAYILGRSDEERRAVIVRMAERGIACNVHYKPLPMMTAYKALGFNIADYPNAFHLFENEVTLPLHTKLTDEDIEYVTSNFVDIVKSL